jgi:hypothetical protein
MNHRAIIVGNGISLDNWCHPAEKPANTDIIATGASWPWLPPDWIVTRYPQIPHTLPQALHSRVILDETQESSGAWATLWALDQGYEEIWLLGLDSATNLDYTSGRTYTHDWMPHNSQPKRWHRDFQRVWYYRDAIFKLRPLITRTQREIFENTLGFRWRHTESRGRGRLSWWEMWESSGVEDHRLEP